MHSANSKTANTSMNMLDALAQLSHRIAPLAAAPSIESTSRSERFQGFSGMGPQKQIALTVLQYVQGMRNGWLVRPNV